MSLILLINGIDYSSYLKVTSLNITENWQGERNKCSFRLENVPFELRPVSNAPLVILDTYNNPDYPTIVNPEFEGMVINPRSVDIGSKNIAGEEAVSYDLDCGNVADAFYQHLVTDSYVNKFTGFILRDQIKLQAPHIDVSGIPDGKKNHPFWGVQLEPLTKFIDSLAATEGWQWYLDGYKIIVGERNQNLANFTITDDNLHKLGGMGIEMAPEDASQMRNVIFYEFSARVTDGRAAVKTGDAVVDQWTDDASGLYDRYRMSSDWSALTDGGVFSISGIANAYGSPGNYGVNFFSPYTGSAILSNPFAEFATEGEVQASPAPTKDGFRTIAVSVEQQTAIDRLVHGGWMRVRTAAGLESRYVKAIVRVAGVPSVGVPTTYDITFGDGNPSVPNDPSTSGAVPLSANPPLYIVSPTTADIWCKLENYTITDIPSILVKEDSDSIEAVRNMLGNGDTGRREDTMRAEFVMSFQEAIDRVNATLKQLSNPLVSFKINTTSWQLAQEGQFDRVKAGWGVPTYLQSRAINAVQTIKQVVRRPAGAYDDLGRVLWKVTLDFTDRLFFLYNVVKRIKEDLQALGADNRKIRSVLVVRESMRVTDQHQNPGDLLNETMYVGNGAAIKVLEIMEDTGILDDTAFTNDHEGPYKYGYSKYGWSQYSEA